MKTGMKIRNGKSVKYPMFLLVCFFMQAATAQVKVTVRAQDSLAFIAYFQEEKINNRPVSAVTMAGLKAGKNVVRLSFGTLQTEEVEQIFTWKDRTELVYEIREVKGVKRIVPVSESPYSPPLAATADTLIAPLEDAVPIATGCLEPLSTLVFEEWKERIQSQPFEARKLDVMSGMLSVSCVKVNQLAWMLQILEMEENKLRLLEQARSHVFDLNNTPLLVSQFYLAKYRERAAAELESWTSD
jgi:hypothetical protein